MRSEISAASMKWEGTEPGPKRYRRMPVPTVVSRLLIQELAVNADFVLSSVEEDGGSCTGMQPVRMIQLYITSDASTANNHLPPMGIETVSFAAVAAIFKSAFTLPVNDKNSNMT